MKKMILMAVMMAIAFSARAMSYMDARNEALYLSDKMAYELNLSMAQFDAVYEINFDYFYMVNHRSEVNGKYWRRRNSDMKYVLSSLQYNHYRSIKYFYRPLGWSGNSVVYNIYSYYRNRNHLYYEVPSVFDNYRGGHSNSSGSYYSGRSFDNGRHPNAFSYRGGYYDNWRQSGNSNSWNYNNNGGNMNDNRPDRGNSSGGSQGGSSWHIGNQNNNQGNSGSNASGNGSQKKNDNSNNASRSGQGSSVKFGSNASKNNSSNANQNNSGSSSRSGAKNDSEQNKNDNSNASSGSQSSSSSKSNNAGTFGGRRK